MAKKKIVGGSTLMHQQHVIQIALPVFNGADHLAQALDSLLNQTYENFELTIVDNASSDNTADISRRYERRDPRVRYVRFDNLVNWVENWARAYDLVAGKANFFMWASDDDLWARDYIESLLQPLLDDPRIILSFSQAHLMDAEGNVVGTIYRNRYPHGSSARSRIQSIVTSESFSAIYGLMRTEQICWKPILTDIYFDERDGI